MNTFLLFIIALPVLIVLAYFGTIIATTILLIPLMVFGKCVEFVENIFKVASRFLKISR
jgi:hypothetical protein